MRGIAAISLGLLVSFSAGCGSSPKGPATHPVSGTVTFDGEPLKTGDIQFEPEAAGTGPDAGAIVNGKFSFRAKAGKKRVKITASRDVAGKTMKGAMGEDIPVREDFVPERYNAKTELTADVQPKGANAFDFKLTSK
jgi:hypothetical protein